MSNPPVSVCLTTYNRASMLSGTLDSILSQGMGDFELIVSDDGSTDATEEVCRDYAAKDNRISYFRNGSNLRMPGNLNAAIGRANAPLVANLHDGDVYRPDLLSKWKIALENQPDAAFVFNALEAIDFDGRHIRFHTHEFGPRIEPLSLTRFMLNQLTSPVWGTVMARRSSYEKSGMFKTQYGFISDVEMWMRLNVDHPVAYIAEPLVSVTPRELTHPYAYVDWRLEQITITIQRDIIALLEARGLIRAAEARRHLQKLRERRWLFLAGSCLKRRRTDLLTEALKLFGNDDSLLLRSVATLAFPLRLIAGRR